MHTSVLLNEVLTAFQERQIHTFIDGTVGLGGHSEALLNRHPEINLLLGIDQDDQALSYAATRLALWGNKVRLRKANFVDLVNCALEENMQTVDGILLDLGVSSLQLDEPARGFSFMKEGPLDMRMDFSQSLTAEEIVNNYSEKELIQIFRLYGEEPKAKQAAKMIVTERKKGPICTTLQLVKILEPLQPFHRRRIHPATLIFQALRIAVNDELEVLKTILPLMLPLLKKGGRLAIISFHSLEDRIVKEFLREEASDKVSTSGRGGVFLDKMPTLKLLCRKPITATEEEQQRNPRSRSAKLRLAEKL